MSAYNSEIEDIELESVADLAEQMVFRLNGCTPATIRKMLQIAFADFARVSCCFTNEIEIETEEDEMCYPVQPTLPKMFVDTVSAVWIGKRRLTCPQHYRVMVIGDTPTIMLNDNLAGCVDENLRVRIIELPKMGSETAPKWFLNKYGEAVVAGALSRLFAMTGKPWADSVQAQTELIRYENFTTNARINSASEDGSQFGNGDVNTIDMSGML